MPLIKDGQLSDDTWQHIDDDAPIPAEKFSVSLARWQAEQSELEAYVKKGQLALRMNGDDPLESINAAICGQFPMIALEFPAFADGRCFSYARTLRDAYQYKGEIRAIGGFIRDQLYFLSRVGFNAFEFDTAEAAKKALDALDEFSVHYQYGSDGKPVIRQQLNNHQ